MKTIKGALLHGFVIMPHDLMQAGWPLKLDLYRYTPIQNRLELFGRKGEVLELAPFLEISMNPTVLILVEERSLVCFREAGSESIAHVEYEEAA